MFAKDQETASDVMSIFLNSAMQKSFLKTPVKKDLWLKNQA